MEDLVLKATSSTPRIELITENSSLTFEGVSFTENALDFYKPVFNWIENLHSHIKKNRPSKITCNYKFEYLNSSSYIVVRDITEKLLDITEESKVELEVNWFYEQKDLDMFELAKEFEFLLDIKINFYHLSNN